MSYDPRSARPVQPPAPANVNWLVVILLVLCAALYWGQNWARWALLAPVGFRVWRLSLLTATAWGLGRPGIALFLTLIILVELAAAFILLDRYLRYSPFLPSHKNATTMSS